MRFICFIAFLILFLNFKQVQAQSNGLLRKQALESMEKKDWYAAQQYFSRLYTRDSSLSVLHSYAESARLSFDVDIALKLYKKTITIDNGDRYPLSIYWYAQLQKNKMQYGEAKRWFAKFLRVDLKKDKYNYYRKKAKLETAACDYAAEQVKRNDSLSIRHLEPAVNSRTSEYGAMEFDSLLYFSSTRPDKKEEDGREPPVTSKIYRAELRYGKPQRARVLDTSFNAPGFHNANTAISKDKKMLVFSRCTAPNATDFQCELLISLNTGRRWGTPVKLEQPVNQPSVSTTQPAFGKIDNNTVLFFSSNRAGGQGGMDIWYSVINEDGVFAEPVNAGDKVNTPDDEVTPWYDHKKKFLYFSSTYHKGFGSFDIFKTEWKNGGFTEPENAGYPINSSFNDVYYSISNYGTHVYLSSNRKGTLFDNNKVNCCSDIFTFIADTTTPPPPPPPKVDSVVLKKDEMKLLVPLTLYFHNDEPDPRTTAITTRRNYAAVYKDYMKMRKTYVREYTRGLKGTEEQIAENNVRNFFSDSVAAGLENLDKFAQLMKEVLMKGETVEITLKGYCSPLASTDYNINLAKRRISSLRNYFNEKFDGWFLKYIDNKTPGEGRITFTEVEIGELPVTKTSDDQADKRNSVYSPSAASERKIQIIAVSFVK
jgi:hypothetical protein